nr:hypothetical protein [Bacteroidales bacterium]
MHIQLETVHAPSLQGKSLIFKFWAAGRIRTDDLNKGANCGNNMSGVKNVYIALKDNVAQFPTLPSNRTSYEDFALLEG